MGVAAAGMCAGSAFGQGAVLNVGVVHQGPIGDVGWEAHHARSWKAMEAKFGGKVKATVLDNVLHAQDAERVFRQLAAKGHKLIIGTTFSQYATLRKLAPTMPNNIFECCAGIAPLKNMGVFEARSYEGSYLTGLIAGRMTKSNVVGWVGAFPVPQVVYNLGGFVLGARKVNPKVTCKLIWVNSWSDPPKEKDAVNALISQGVDVLSGSPNTPVQGLTAQEKGVWSIGMTIDASRYVKQKQLSSFVLDWSPAYIEAAQGVLDGNWKAESRWRGIGDGGFVKMTTQNTAIPADVLAFMRKEEAAIIAGKSHPFTGPIKDQDGKLRVAAGKFMPDDELRGINWLVEGIQGSLPKN
jgi:simple sugar transport system substrate-binding protein